MTKEEVDMDEYEKRVDIEDDVVHAWYLSQAVGHDLQKLWDERGKLFPAVTFKGKSEGRSVEIIVTEDGKVWTENEGENRILLASLPERLAPFFPGWLTELEYCYHNTGTGTNQAYPKWGYLSEVRAVRERVLTELV